MKNTLVSVIMPSFNTPSDYLHEAVTSVLNQTYKDLELLIIDDGSEPSVKETLCDIKDERMRVIENPGNKGLPYSLNRGLEEAEGKYIFRMDADDICANNRIESQVDWFEKYLDIDVIASYAQTFGDRKVIYKSGCKDSQIKAGFLWKNELVHPTVAFRAEVMKKKEIRYRKGVASEDYELWSRMAFEYECRFAVIPETLLCYRLHGGQVTKNNARNLEMHEFEIIRYNLKLLGIQLSDEQIVLYNRLRINDELDNTELKKAFGVCREILRKIPAELDRDYLRKMYRKQALKYCIRHKKYKEMRFIPLI